MHIGHIKIRHSIKKIGGKIAKAIGIRKHVSPSTTANTEQKAQSTATEETVVEDENKKKKKTKTSKKGLNIPVTRRDNTGLKV